MKQQSVKLPQAFIAGLLMLIAMFAPFGLKDFTTAHAQSVSGTLVLRVLSATCTAGLPEVALSWTPASGAVSYMLQRRLEPNRGWSGPALDSGISSTAYTDKLWATSYGVMTYYYQVAALSSDGSRVYSNEVSIVVPNCRTTQTTAPQPTPIPIVVSRPVTVVPVLRVLSATCTAGLPEVALSWTPASGAVSYMLQRRLEPNRGWSGPALDSGISSTAYTDKLWATSYGVMTYYYQVAALSSDGSRVYSNEVSIVVPNCRTTQTTAPQPTPIPTPTPQVAGAQTPVPGKMPAGLRWGAGVDWREGSLAGFEERVGHTAHMQMIFSHWGNDPGFPTQLGGTIRDQGKTMVLFWEAVDYNRPYFSQPEYSYDAVLSGRMDSYFRNFAAGARAYGGEVILIPYSEFNGGWFPWGVYIGNNSPQKLAEAFRYITRFFDDAPNVKFAWVPNAEASRDDRLSLAYPGDAYVDYVGADGFNFGGGEEMTFHELFGNTLTRLASYNKPTMIFSMGTHAGPGKAAWITDALTVQLYTYPHVVGWLWFNENKETDWRVWSDPQSLAAFSNAIR